MDETKQQFNKTYEIYTKSINLLTEDKIFQRLYFETFHNKNFEEFQSVRNIEKIIFLIKLYFLVINFLIK